MGSMTRYSDEVLPEDGGGVGFAGEEGGKRIAVSSRPSGMNRSAGERSNDDELRR